MKTRSIVLLAAFLIASSVTTVAMCQGSDERRASIDQATILQFQKLGASYGAFEDSETNGTVVHFVVARYVP